MWKRKRRRDMADVNIYTAERLSEMARSLGVLARACNDRMEEERGTDQGGCPGGHADGSGRSVRAVQPVQSVQRRG